MNYNKISFIFGIAGALIGLVAGVGVPLTIQFFPQKMAYLIMSIMGSVVILLFLQMIVMFLSPGLMRKFVSLVFVIPIILVTFFSLFLYQQIAPVNGLYLEQIKQIDFFSYFRYFPVIFPAIMVIFMSPLIIWVLKFMWQNIFSREKILQNGIAASAKVLEITFNGVKINNQPVYKITLEITSPHQGIYQISKDFLIPDIDLNLLQPDKIVPVKIDPHNRDNVFFDTWTGNVK